MTNNTTPQTPPTPQKWHQNYIITVFVIGLPALVVVACVFFVIFAFKNEDATVRDDWYMDSKALYQDASKDQLAHDLGVSGVMRFDGDDVVFELHYKDNITPAYPNTLSVNISHATDKNKDKDLTLIHSTNNIYTGKVSIDPLPSKYYLHINSNDGWRLTQTQKLPAQNVPFSPLSAFDEINLTLPDQRHKRHLENTLEHQSNPKAIEAQ